MAEWEPLLGALIGSIVGNLSIIVYYAWKLGDPWWLLRHHDS